MEEFSPLSNDSESEPSDRSRIFRRLKRKLKRPAVVALLFVFIALVSVSVLLWREWSKRFPGLESGAYLGELFIPEEGGKLHRLSWYVESPERNNELLSVVLTEASTPEIVQAVAASGSNGVRAYLPITIKTNLGSVLLTGDVESAGQYSGKIESSIGEGRWRLTALPALSEPQPEAVNDVKLWVLLRSELEGVEEGIVSAEGRVPEQRAEIEKLTDFITEGERLKARANEKFEALKAKLAKAQATLKARQAEAAKLEGSLQISQKVTSMGKLVALSRDSLEREGRWLDSMLRSESAEGSRELNDAVRRAEAILDMKRQIVLEKSKIDTLRRGKIDPPLPPGQEVVE